MRRMTIFCATLQRVPTRGQQRFITRQDLDKSTHFIRPHPHVAPNHYLLSLVEYRSRGLKKTHHLLSLFFSHTMRGVNYLFCIFYLWQCNFDQKLVVKLEVQPCVWLIVTVTKTRKLSLGHMVAKSCFCGYPLKGFISHKSQPIWTVFYIQHIITNTLEAQK